MLQRTLDTFLQNPKQFMKGTGAEKRTAKEILEPLFVRPLPSHSKYKIQLEKEYELIDKNNFTNVFLQVYIILELIHRIGEETEKPIPHIIRGSAGSSLICYLLGITQIDPIIHGIQLARFMNSLRRDIPDIDIDVPYNRREEIYGRIAETWPGVVARISNYCMWSHKTAMRESIKELLHSRGESIPKEIHRKHYDAMKIVGDKESLEIVKEKTKEKEGTLKHYSKHCGGIVIFEEAIPEELIFQKIQSNGKSLVQIKLNKDDTEAQGYIKIDILSNRGLAQIADICPERPFTAYPVRDGATERIFEKGWNLGITFGESRGMRKIFMEMKPKNIREIAIALALIRPAAAAEGRKQDFLGKWKKSLNEQPIIYDDDAILKIKKYLECTDAEADRWRKAFSKNDAHSRIQFRRLLYSKGYSENISTKLIDDLNQLVYYSFCKSHAISYAQLVWALAYWKAHRTHEFWVAALNHCHTEYRKWVHYREAKCSGLSLSRSHPPYKVGIRDGKPALVSSLGEQQLLHPLSPIDEYKQLGYWTTDEFLPKCGIWFDTQTRLDGKKNCTFRGLIANGRVIHRDWGNCTLFCLGIENRTYIDVVIPEMKRSELFRWAVLEGSGLYFNDKIEVKQIRGVSLKNMV